jgi:hypothetical protein
MGYTMTLKIERSTEEINSIGGISLIGNNLNRLQNLKSINLMNFSEVKSGTISHCDMVKSFIGLLSLGKTDYADIELYRKDMFFRDSLNLKIVPSESILRQRLDIMGLDEKVIDFILKSNVELLSKVKDFGTERTEHSKYIPVDVDVSVLDNSGSKKEGVSWSYANVDGYAPMFSYIGTYGYMLNCELRPGSQHSNNGMVEYLSSLMDLIDVFGIKNPLLRLDSAHDDAKVVRILLNRKQNFIIKQNLRKQSKEQLLDLAKSVGSGKTVREGKNVYTGILSHKYPADCEDIGPIFMVYEITERSITSSGQVLLIPEIEVNAWWTNLYEEAETVIELYHRHGTSEQFHSELKSDIGIERLPSGKFSTNDLILRLGMLAFNVLRLIGQTALEFKEQFHIKLDVIRRRLKSVLQDFVYIACKRVSHAGRTILKFGRNCPWVDVFRQLHVTFC